MKDDQKVRGLNQWK